MRRSQSNNRILISLLVVFCLCLVVGLTLGKYVDEWKHGFGLLISPTEQIDVDTTLHMYFRSNELKPASEAAEYTVNGTSGWFTVANALDSVTVSEGAIKYTLTWYVSTDGNDWTEYKKENGAFEANAYNVAKYTVEPVTVNGTVYNNVKVHGKTSSFRQEDIEAVYTFNYSDYTCETAYSNGVITVKIDTNDMSGDYKFTWQEGITPDNSDPNGLFANAPIGPSELTVALKNDTEYEFLFFITDAELLNSSFDAESIVTVTKN